MKLKIKQVVESFQVLGRLGQEKMPIKLAYIIQRNLRLLNPEYSQWDEQRTSLIKEKYGVKDEAGNYTVTPDKMPEFQTEMDTLGDVEVELDLHTISMIAWGRDISPLDFMILDWMILPGEE